MDDFSPATLAKLTEQLLLLSGAQSLNDHHRPRAIGALLAQWANQSATHRRHFNNALDHDAGRVFVRNRTKEAVQAYAKEVLPPLGACQLLLELQAPHKAGFRILSKYFTSADLPPWARPICSHEAFHAKWKELLKPLELDAPVRTASPAATGVSWGIHSWVEYIASRPALVDAIDFDGPPGMEGLHLIVRGDGYPIAGTTFCNLCIALANHGPEARRPAMNWPIGLATCADKDSDALRQLWAKNIEVCFLPRNRLAYAYPFVHTQCL